jgi:hypothetical protein
MIADPPVPWQEVKVLSLKGKFIAVYGKGAFSAFAPEETPALHARVGESPVAGELQKASPADRWSAAFRFPGQRCSAVFQGFICTSNRRICHSIFVSGSSKVQKIDVLAKPLTLSA